jgi:hypothetical protein
LNLASTNQQGLVAGAEEAARAAPQSPDNTSLIAKEAHIPHVLVDSVDLWLA